MSFTVNKEDSDTINHELKTELESRNIAYDYSSGPGFWDRYGFLFVTTGLILLLGWVVLG